MPGEFSAPRHAVCGQRGGIIFRLFCLIVLVFVAALLFLGRDPILRAFGHFWIVDQPPEYADAIFVQGDTYYSEHANRAAELYHVGWAPRIIAGGFMLRPYMTTVELMQRDLEQRGVPPNAIIAFPLRATDTREQAADLAQYMQQQGWHRVLWISANYHTRRAEYICERVFPANIQFRVIAARDSAYDPDSWWKTRGGAKFLFHETFGMIVAMWELRKSPPVSRTDWGALKSQPLGREPAAPLSLPASVKLYGTAVFACLRTRPAVL